MEKTATKPKNKILKLLPRAAQAGAISFQNLPFSPRRDNRPDANGHRPKAHHGKGFSGPLLPMIPAEARRKNKNFETQEPTSPKVSCIGQVKCKNKVSKKKHMSLPKENNPASKPEKSRKPRPVGPDSEVKKKKPSGIKKIFGRKSRAATGQAEQAESAPSLGQMRKFASSREAFANFDWTAAQIAPEEDRGFYSDGERGYSDGEDDIIIPFSEPILKAGAGIVTGVDLEPRKEINLWKRRTMAQPAPLRLNTDCEN